MVELAEIGSLHDHAARGRLVDGADEVEQGGLAGAAGPQDHGELPLGHYQVHFLEGVDGGSAFPVGLPHALHRDRDHGITSGAWICLQHTPHRRPGTQAFGHPARAAGPKTGGDLTHP